MKQTDDRDPARAACRILVVEDERPVALDIERSLVDLGYAFAGSAARGEDALDIARSTRPDLVLMDIRLRGTMDGIDAAAAIQANMRIPVVFLSANSDRETVRRARRVAPFGYLVKPFQRAELACAIEVALERWQVHERIRERERLLELTLRSIGDGVLTTNARYELTFMNRVAEELTGWAAHELRGTPLAEALELVAEASGRPVPWPLANDVAGPQIRHLPEPSLLRTRSGDLLPIGDSQAPIVDDRGTLLGTVVVFRDARAEHEAAREIRRLNKAELTYHTLFDNTTDGVWILSRAGILLDCNRSTERIHAIGRAQMLGIHFSTWLHPDSLERTRSSFALLSRGEPVRADGVQILRPDRSRRTVDLSACPVVLGDREVVIVLEHDVTEQRHLEDENRQLQKMEAVGALSGGIAHDFNNILCAILANGQFLLDEIGADDPRREDADEICRAAERGAALTQQLLAFSRSRSAEPTVMDLREVAVGMEKMLRRLISEDIALSMEASGGRSWVKADPGRVQQVLMNLAVNARDAMPRGGSLRIEISNVELDQITDIGDLPIVPGSYVAMVVRDDGSGMDDETRRRAFDPFFTTKEPGRGTGLGLATVHSIVRQNAGYISLDSERGRGTAVTIYLPRVAPPAELDDVEPEEVLVAGVETILIVEDDVALQCALRKILTTSGYRALVAGSAAEALDVAAQHVGPIHALLSDYIIPDKNGPEIAVLLTACIPDLRVLFMSGYPDHASMGDETVGERANYLKKPFTPETLLRKLRAILDGDPQSP